MRFFILILFVSSVVTDNQVTKEDDKKVEDLKDLKVSIEEIKSKTEKRDSSVQTGSFDINSNDEPFKPMLGNSPIKYGSEASGNQQVFYDKNQVTARNVGGNSKSGTNSQTTNAYREQYSQVSQQHQKQQSQNKNHLGVVAKDVAIQQQILYAVPQNPPYHYERIPQQQQQHQSQSSTQHGQQKQMQYVIAIPLSYLRQIQQQFVHQQQQQEQIYKGQQQPQHLHQQQQQLPTYSIIGPLAKDHQGAYRPLHRFSLTAVKDASTGAQHQIGSPTPVAAPGISVIPPPSGYVSQYVQIPTSALMAALQSTQIQQRPVHLAQNIYPQQQQQQQQPQTLQHQEQLQPQLQFQQPIQQQNALTPASQFYYLQPQFQQVSQPLQLKQSLPSQALSSPSVYAYHINPLQQQNQQQLQHPSQSYPTYLAEQHQNHQQQQEQQKQLNVGKQTFHVGGVEPNVNLAPRQYHTNTPAHEHEEKSHLLSFETPNQLHEHTQRNAHNQQYIVQGRVAQPAQNHQVAQVSEVQSPETYEQVFHHYNPQYVQQEYPGQQQQQRQPQHQQHRLQVQSSPVPSVSPSAPQQQHVTSFVERLNNFPFSQAIHSPTPLPFLHINSPVGVHPFYNYNIVSPPVPQPIVASGLQRPFTPLGIPNKVTPFTNDFLQPFREHPSPFQAANVNAAVHSGPNALPYFHQAVDIRYGTQAFHPPTSIATLNLGSKPVTPAVAHPGTRVLNAGGVQKVSASSAKASVASVVGAIAATVAGNSAIVKYP